MKQDEFVNKFWEIKQSASDIRFPIGNLNIQRGNRVISSDLEDLFAIYVAERINKPDYKYYIDKSISYNSKDKTRGTFKPDFFVIDKSKKAVAYFDVKTDLGSKGEFQDFLNSKIPFIKKIRNAEAWISKHPDEKYKIAGQIKYVVVVGIDHQRTSLIETFRSICKKSKGCLEIFFLTHWENFNAFPQPPFTIRQDDFDLLDKYLKTL